MKRLFVLLLVVLVVPNAFAQQSKSRPPSPSAHPPTVAEARRAAYNCQCTYHNTYSTVQRLKLYPFNKAAKVILVSFYGLEGYSGAGTGHYLHNLGFDTVGKLKFPFVNKGWVDTSVLLERTELTKAQVNKLTDVLYNTDVRAHYGLEIADPGSKCYNPRNAILFADAQGKIFAEMVICFECQKIELRPQKIAKWEWCDGKFRIIKNFFETIGLRWGVTVKEQHS